MLRRGEVGAGAGDRASGAGAMPQPKEICETLVYKHSAKAGSRDCIAIALIRRVVEARRSILELRGFVTISSKAVYRLCLDSFDEGECKVIVAIAAGFLNTFAERINRGRPAKWRITKNFLLLLNQIESKLVKSKQGV
jgi:hypothetical protein